MKLVIFGCGKIANRIAASCKLVEGLKLAGFGSHNIEKAKEYSMKYECEDYGDYEHFLKNPEIDAVYVATYNLSHYEVIKECLKAHKSVICEKPMLSSIEENNELFDLAKENNVCLMEAMKAVFLPINIKVKQLMKDGELGMIMNMHASFARGELFDKSHWIFDKKTGGALKDVGSYCAGILNFLTDKEPEDIKVKKDGSETVADRTAEVFLNYGNISAHIKASNEFTEDSCLIVRGTDGILRVDNFWKTGNGFYEINGTPYYLEEEIISDFYYELKHFKELVESKSLESPVMSRLASNRILMITAKGE